jgi:hypothetical protein
MQRGLQVLTCSSGVWKCTLSLKRTFWSASAIHGTINDTCNDSKSCTWPCFSNHAVVSDTLATRMVWAYVQSQPVCLSSGTSGYTRTRRARLQLWPMRSNGHLQIGALREVCRPKRGVHRCAGHPWDARGGHDDHMPAAIPPVSDFAGIQTSAAQSTGHSRCATECARQGGLPCMGVRDLGVQSPSTSASHLPGTLRLLLPAVAFSLRFFSSCADRMTDLASSRAASASGYGMFRLSTSDLHMLPCASCLRSAKSSATAALNDGRCRSCSGET